MPVYTACPTCGAVIADRELHVEYHAANAPIDPEETPDGD